MSHFGVLVRVPASVDESDLEAAVTALLAPFQENNMGDCPKQYMEFTDEEDELRTEFDTEGTEMIELASGKRVYSWDEQFRVAGSVGIGGGTHKVPDELKRVTVLHRERFESFEHFVKEWHGTESRDPEKGRYGRWDNPNKTWDWWVIGGRWSRFIPVNVGGAENYARVCNVDTAKANRETGKKAAQFWVDWQRFVAGEKSDDPFDGPRETALRLGLVDCKNADELTGSEWKTIPWGRELKPGVARFDVLKEISEADALALYRRVNFALRTYAYLDSAGWHAPGEMGWWGMSSENTEALAKYADEQAAWLASGDQRDWIVAVDCHI